MVALITCRPCIRKGNCEIQAGVLAAIKGLGVSSLKHRCAEVELPYRAGQAVWVFVQVGPSERDEMGPELEPSKGWFPGHFLQVARTNTSALIVITDGAEERDHAEYEFEPMKRSSRGGGSWWPAVCKVPWSRIRLRNNVEALAVCDKCGQLAGMSCEGVAFLDREGRCPLENLIESPAP